MIAKELGSDIHHVWCSPVFDPRRLTPDDRGSLIPPTSSPYLIAKDLASAVKNKDKHNSKIVSQKVSLAALVEQWRIAGTISEGAANNFMYMLRSDELFFWRPLIYVIPASGIDASRIILVPPEERAGFGDEYKIVDLKGSEFDRIELDVD